MIDLYYCDMCKLLNFFYVPSPQFFNLCSPSKFLQGAPRILYLTRSSGSKSFTSFNLYAHPIANPQTPTPKLLTQSMIAASSSLVKNGDAVHIHIQGD